MDSLAEKVDKGIADKLQHQISQTFRKSLRLEVMQMFPDPRAQVYFNSIRDEDAGKLLDMAPKTSMHRSENHNFKKFLQMRLFMPQVPECTCLCKNHVDAEGFHWRGGCGHGGIRTNTHNKVAAMIYLVVWWMSRTDRRSPRKET